MVPFNETSCCGLLDCTNREAHRHVRLSRAGITSGSWQIFGIRWIGDIPNFDPRIMVDLVNDGGAVGQPPITIGSTHLLLRNELCAAVGFQTGAISGDGLFLLGVQIVYKQIIVANISDVLTIWRRGWIDNCRIASF